MGEPKTRHLVVRNEQAVISLVGQFTQVWAQHLIPLSGEWLVKIRFPRYGSRKQ